MPMEVEIGTIPHKPGNVQDCMQTPEAKPQGTNLPLGLQKEPAL